MRKTESAVRGQKIRTESAPDRSSHKPGGSESMMGRSMSGGPNDVSHSLSGAGQTVTYNDKAPKRR